MKTKIAITIMAIAIMLGFQGCSHDDPKITVNSNDFTFKAVNLTVEEGKLSANGGAPITVNWSVNVTVNGETTMVSGTCKSNELPVKAGDELEIQLNPSCPEQTEGNITLPDGTLRELTTSSPTFKWTVPDDFTPGIKIKGESHYETGDAIYHLTGVIILVELK